MYVHFKGISGLVVVLAALVVPGLVIAYLLRSPFWIAIVPGGLILLICAIAALPIKRKITAQQFADLLEPHLLGTDGDWGWDDTISVRLADDRLEQFRVRLGKFDSLVSEDRYEELRQIIAALRRGEVPEVKDNEGSQDVPRFWSS